MEKNNTINKRKKKLITWTPSADGILLLKYEALAEIEGHRERLQRQEKPKLEEAAKREKKH